MDSDLGENRKELQSLRRGWSAFTYRSLIFWLIRWTIGFTLIGLVAAHVPALSWLWWVGIGVAVLSPVITLASQWRVSRKIREAESALTKLDNALQDLEKG